MVPALTDGLAAIRDLEDLQFLVRLTGTPPRPAPTHCDDLGPPGQIVRALSLGATTHCRWLGVVSPGAPERVAARLARRLEREPAVSCVLALHPEKRQLAVAISVPPYPVLNVSLDAPDPVALRCLERLREAGREDGLAAVARIARALDGQAVGRRFFEAFRSLLRRMQQALPPRIPAADRHALALLDLTRTLFLYFVQAKGWLDGRHRFLAEEVDRTLAGGRHLHTNLLRPLFFGTLNQPGANRGAVARRFGAIPFLNGGLFEPHPLERRWRTTFPNELLRDAFDLVFERFHFTVHESESVAIAPDMLGRVFEGVMDPEERGATGTFYTPAALVNDLLTAAFEAQLSERLRCGADEAGRRLRDPDQSARELLLSLRILDPAVGSGAFLLGAFQRLTEVHGTRSYGAGHTVLARNLFGVDVNPAAVRLAELRLWLALIGADRAEDPAEVAPLPNLDSLVRVGDSLGLAWRESPGRTSPAAAARVRASRTALLVAVGPGKRQALRELRAAEQEAAAELLRARAAAVQVQLHDLAAVRRSPTLFGEARGLERRERMAMERLRAERAFLHAARRRLEREEVLPWFEYETQFADVFAERGGFDLVVGNPPWVRAEELPGARRTALSARFRWWVAGGSSGYRHQPDLAVAFLERAFELAAPDGTVAMLVPSKLATAAYARAARSALARDHRLHRVVDLAGDPRASFEATVYPMALVAGKGGPGPGHRVRFTWRDQGAAEGRPQAGLGAAPWVLVAGASVDAVEAARGGHPRLGDRLRASLGVKTGCNAVFIDPEAPIEPELLRWGLRGRDVRAFRAAPRHRLLWTHGEGGQPLAALPPRAGAWLARHGGALRARKDWKGGTEWALFRTRAATCPHRVVWADLARRLEATALGAGTDGLIPLNSCYVLPVRTATEANCLAAWLNCTWMRALAAATADSAAGGYRRYKAGVVESLPLPPAVGEDAALAALAVAGAEGRLDQAELDAACNRHLRLDGCTRDALARLVPAASDHRR